MMNSQLNISPKFVLACMVSTILMAPALVFAHGAGTGKPPVNLAVNTAGELVTATRSNCTGQPSRPEFVEPGCVRFGKGLSDTVKFNLPTTICKPASGGNPVVHWQLDGVQLANVNNSNKPAPWPASNPNLDARAIRDFGTDTATGWIKNIGSAGPQIMVTNRNLSAKGYNVWYRVRASCPGTSVSPIYLDPRFDNEGTP